jgi:tetratricopeptide (TPR) repeat protein
MRHSIEALMKEEDKIAFHTIWLFFKAVRSQYVKSDYVSALKSYQQIIESGHRYIDAFLGMGVCYKMLNDNEAAEAAIKEALEISPTHFKSPQLLASIYTSQGRDELTYEYVSRALSNIPRSTAEMSPRMATFARKLARYTYSGSPDAFVEDTLGLEEEDRIWISWAREFKSAYESKQANRDSTEQ